MADIVYQPGQAVPAGNYIVILRPVDGNPMPPAQVPDMEPPAEPPTNKPAPVGPPQNKANPTGGRRKGKKEKKSKGTRKLSPYMKFAQEARPKILKENPDMKSDIIGVGRKIGEMWRALSDAEKARY